MLKSRLYIGAALACVLAACGGDPEFAAGKAIEKAATEWTDSQSIMDPNKRIKAYDKVIKTIEQISDKYEETALGNRLAEGRVTAGVSPRVFNETRDRLAERADCYKSPDVTCLKPFSTLKIAHRNTRRSTGRQTTGAQRARQNLCGKGLDAVRGELDYLSVNKSQLSDEFVQLAFAAKECDRQDDLASAINVAIDVRPGGAQGRARFIATLMNTADFASVWPDLANRLEEDLSADVYEDSLAAGIVIQLAEYYATSGNVEASHAKVNYLQDTLNYRLPRDLDKTLAAWFLFEGSAEAADAIRPLNLKSAAFRSRAVSTAIKLLLSFDAQGAVVNKKTYGSLINSDTTYEDLLPKLDASVAEDLLAKAVFLEAQMDAVYEEAITGNHTQRFGQEYADLAAIYVRLGDQEKADKALEKISRAAWWNRSLAGEKKRYTDRSPRRSNNARYLMALRDRNFDALLQGEDVRRLASISTDLLLREIAKTGDAEYALQFATQLSKDQKVNGEQYKQIVEALLEADFDDEAARVFATMPVNDYNRTEVIWALIDSAFVKGDFAAAEKLSENLQFEISPDNQAKFLTAKTKAIVARGDKKESEAAIREAFALGQRADEIIAFAYEAGYLELGHELFREAENKSHQSISHALDHIDKPAQLTELLMLGHDGLQKREMEIFITEMINHLSENEA